MNENKIVTRRNILKGSIFAGLVGVMITNNPVKILPKGTKEKSNKLKVKKHPLAVKRNIKDKS